jgi:methylmalonyl-CoA mutase
VGGADSLASSPFDEAIGLPDAFSRRIALNTQVLLKEETHLRRVTDPAGGSWYVESLTDQLARAAWALFQEFESKGGMIQALVSGVVADQVGEVSAAKELAIATRKDAITGVSEFANLDEKPLEKEAPDLIALRAQAVQLLRRQREARDTKMLQEKLEALAKAGRALPQRMSLAIEAAQAGATLQELIGAGTVEREPVRISPLPARREAQGFEALRAASDAVLAKDGQRPVIFLANLGSIPKHKTRSGFAQNFFEAGGLQALTNDGFASADDAMTAFKGSGASLVVICSSDDVYESMAVDTARKLKEAGAVRVLLAGKPAGQEELRAAGVDGFIYLGANVLEIVGELMGCLGVLS